MKSYPGGRAVYGAVFAFLLCGMAVSSLRVGLTLRQLIDVKRALVISEFSRRRAANTVTSKLLIHACWLLGKFYVYLDETTFNSLAVYLFEWQGRAGNLFCYLGLCVGKKG